MFCREPREGETKPAFEREQSTFGGERGRFGRFSNNWDRFGKGGRMEETKVKVSLIVFFF